MDIYQKGNYFIHFFVNKTRFDAVSEGIKTFRIP